MIDVSDLKPAAVLAGLFNASKSQGMGRFDFKPESMTEAEAEELLTDEENMEPDGSMYFDYLQGRVMKIAIGTPFIDERLYDRDNGQGAVRDIVRALRAVAQVTKQQESPSPKVDF